MFRFRTTVWYLKSAVAAVEGEQGRVRRIVTGYAPNKATFLARVTDELTGSDVDCEVSFGSTSQRKITKEEAKRLGL